MVKGSVGEAAPVVLPLAGLREQVGGAGESAVQHLAQCQLAHRNVFSSVLGLVVVVAVRE